MLGRQIILQAPKGGNQLKNKKFSNETVGEVYAKFMADQP